MCQIKFACILDRVTGYAVKFLEGWETFLDILMVDHIGKPLNQSRSIKQAL